MIQHTYPSKAQIRMKKYLVTTGQVNRTGVWRAIPAPNNPENPLLHIGLEEALFLKRGMYF